MEGSDQKLVFDLSGNRLELTTQSIKLAEKKLLAFYCGNGLNSG
jgi:hypothetical protein